MHGQTCIDVIEKQGKYKLVGIIDWDDLREDFLIVEISTFIIDSLAQAQNVKVSEQEVMQTIYYEAMQMGQDPQASYDHYKKAGYIPAIQMSMVEDKVLSGLLNAKIKEA